MSRIMVVEDENIVARDIQETLVTSGHDVPAVAGTGADALAQAQVHRPDLILMDIRLRGAMDGIEAASRIHKLLDVPVIFLTAYADADTTARAKLTEPYGFLLKPYSDKELRSAIEVALYKHKMERQLKDRERWFSTTLKSIGEGVIATDEHDRISFMNPVAETLTGWRREDAAGRAASDVFRLVHEQWGTSVACPTERALREKIVLELGQPVRLVARCGGEIPIDDSAAPIVDDEGKVMGGVLVFRDASDARKRARFAAAVSELERLALGSELLEHVLNAALGLIVRTLELHGCTMFEVTADRRTFVLRWSVGMGDTPALRAVLPNDAASELGLALTSEVPVVVRDARSETRFRATPLFLDGGFQSGVSLRVCDSSGPFAVLSVHDRQQRAYERDELVFMTTVASMLGMIVERFRAQEQLRRSNRAHRALSNCNQALIRASDESSLLAEICRTIVTDAGYRFCWVGRMEHDPNQRVAPVAQAGFEAGYLESANITWADTERGRGPTGTCARTGTAQIAKSIATDPAFLPWRSEALKRGYASMLALPIMVDGELFGALNIYSEEPEAFATEEVDLLSELGADLGYGMAVLRARAELRKLNAELEQRVSARTGQLEAANRLKDELLVREQDGARELELLREREIAIGFKIQRMLLLDQPPRDHRGWQVSALSVPSHRIAGDFYEFFSRDERCIDVIVADVMGKGVPAALLGAATKSHFLEALCHLMASCPKDRLPEPQEIVTMAHADMVRQLMELESFVTLCYARLDLRTRSFDLVDCGHTGALHWHAATRECTALHGDNLPLGVREGTIYERLSVPVAKDDLLVLYSDGITEARNPRGELFGTERLIECLKRNADRELDELIAAIHDATLSFSTPAPLADDLTCVVLKVLDVEPALARAELDILSDPRELRRARALVREVCGALAGSSFDPELQQGMELAVDEAASNVMKHAYHGRTDQRIHLDAETFRTHVSVRMHYLGDSFDPARVSPPEFDGSRESGFGTYLMSRAVDEVRYYRDERGRNCTALLKFLRLT